jgi:short-subunit dehydrogenase
VDADLLDVKGLGVVNVGHGNEHQLKFPIHDRNVSMGLTILGRHRCWPSSTPPMSAGGRIINVSSVSTSWPGADEILYAANKGPSNS